MSARILFYVQHLMGVGHVFRAMRIVRALGRAGFKVDLVHGGEPVPNLDAGGAEVHFLPPLRAGSVEFGKLEAPDGAVAGEAYLTARRERLLATFRETTPDMIITEAFPFGRRQMRFELLPLLDAAKAHPRPPKIVASVRDILQENRKPERDLETAEAVETWYDHVLVHGDPELVRLEATFPLVDRITGKVLYTGIVAPEAIEEEPRRPAEIFDVVVSVGGGVMGRELLFAAASARRLSSLRDARWCIVTGINTSEEDLRHLNTLIAPDVTLRRFLPDLPAVMAHAQLSVSRVGYNTVADICRAGCRAVVVPFSNGKETEQIRRAEMLSAADLVEMVSADEQTPEALAAAIDRTMAQPVPDRSRIRLDGAPRSAEIVSAVLSGGDLGRYRA
ncbi:MAG TPA: glycosyltransferase [Pararhizobium sp.]|nr:glycosyltransferase [Pararhizobium sp.]